MSDNTDGPTANSDIPRGGGDADFSTGLRLGLAAELGHSGHNRDRYDVFGWEREPTPDQYYALYLRNPYAYAAVAQKASTTWRDSPDIVDGVHPDDVDPSDKARSKFERRVRTLQNEKDIWSYASRVDRLAGIGTHGILVLDLDDTDDPDDFSDPPNLSGAAAAGADALRGFRVYSAASIEDIDYGDPGTDMWGMPEQYYIDLRDDAHQQDGSPGSRNMLRVHHERVIDVPAQELDDDEVHARPRIERVLNVVYDIEKSLGAAAELAYAGSKEDIHVNFDPEKVDADQVTNNDDELQDWYHDREPWIRTVGGEVNQISPPEIVDPSGVIDSELKAFSAATDIPQQMLDGSAAGAISAAEQDEKDYFGTISERREQYSTPHIVRSLIDRLKDLGVLPPPEGIVEDGKDYRVEWPDLTELSEKDIGELRNQRAQIVKRLRGAVPELSGDRAETFVESGEFPERPAEGEGVEPIDVEREREEIEGEGEAEPEADEAEPEPPPEEPEPEPDGSEGGIDGL